MRLLKKMISALLVVCMVISMVPMAAVAAENEMAEAAKGRILLDQTILSGQTTVWIDGVEYAVQFSGGSCYVDLPADADPGSMVTYSYYIGNAADVHTQYPVGMEVWALKKNADGSFTPEKVEALANILQYSGSSIRITGNKGIRMLTSIQKNKKNDLVSGGLAGYKLLEYGTVLAWSSNLEDGSPLVLGPEYAKSNYAYKKDEADPVFKYTGDLMQYTNVLVGFSLDQCADDIAMRPYMILEDENGQQMTIYGGIVHRSIGYIAWQNRDVFKPGTAAYNYVWEIIRHVYAEVTFETNGGTAIETVFVQKGTTLKMPAAPERAYRSFVGWYTDAALTEAFDPASVIEEDMTLYAKWETNGPARPENLPEEEEYFWDNSDVIDVINADESEVVPSEEEVVNIFADRGFVEFPITYDFAIDGTFVDNTEVLADSFEKHPVYYTYYRTQNNDIWIIYIINDSILAYPLSYNMESTRSAELIFSEFEYITSYVDGSNKYYVTIPYESMMIVKVIDQINAETLERLTNAAIDALD